VGHLRWGRHRRVLPPGAVVPVSLRYPPCRVDSHVHVEEDPEVYSDPDEGVEIVDMRNVHTMDWMAPESLKSESARERSKKRHAKAKKKEEEEEQTLKGTRCWLLPTREKTNSISLQAKQGPIVTDADDVGDINLANALDLSESEEEEVMEDIIDDFARDSEVNQLHVSRTREKLIFLCAGSNLATRTALFLPVPIAFSYFRLQILRTLR
jgi:hypothetical protein